jgi:type VII secretion-associated serine protease mycosin
VNGRLARLAISRQNGPTVRIFGGRFRPALLATLVAALAAVGAGLVATPARADWVRNDQWQLGALNVFAAWQQATGNGTTVAVLDSGVDSSHEDLAGQVLPGIDLVDGTSDGRIDPVGHGTTVASLIAGRRDETGVVGLAPGAKILPVRVLDRRNRYEDASVIARGIRWAVDHGADVINLSLGGGAHSDVLAGALGYAAEHDVVVIACTGNLAQNNGEPQVWYPAREPGVVAVTGLRAPTASPTSNGWLDHSTGAPGLDELWSGSLTGPQTVLSAPAVNLIGARPGGYWRVQGTSFAAPLVTGAAALVRSKYPRLSAGNVINRMIRTANDLGASGRDDRYGFGVVNPLAALTAEMETVADNPLTGAADASGQAGADSADGSSATRQPADSAESGPKPKPGGGAPSPNGVAVGDAAGHRPTGSITNGAPVGWSVALLVLLLAAVFGSFAVSQGYAQRYFRRGRHAR